MKTGSYLSSSRLYSLIVLLALFVDYNLAAFEAARNNYLMTARQEWTMERIGEERNNFKNDPALSKRFGDNPVDSYIPGVGYTTLAFRDEPTGEGWMLVVHSNNRVLWSSFVSGDQDFIDNPTQQLKDLRGVASEVGLHVDENQSFDSLFVDIERDLAEQKVTIPGLEAAFGFNVAPWIISTLVLSLLIVIRNQLRRVMTDSELALEEPWIILDGQKGLEKLLGCTWLGGILLAPWIANACLLVIFSGQIVANGTVGSRIGFLLACGAALILEVVGGWVSLTTISELLQLRHLRNNKLMAS
jgi:hypothetical protein